MGSREWELVVVGATGFTGQLVADYLSRHAPDLRWALAGRNKEKLERVKAGLPANPDLVQVDSEDRTGVRRLAERTRAVLTTVGPFIHFGLPLARACAQVGTHYLDITGEPEFVHRVRAECGGPARDSGVRLVNCCGFDSIPADFGVYHAVTGMPEGAAGETRVRGYLKVHGGMSGGTWNSALQIMGRSRAYAQLKKDMPLPRRERARGLKLGLHRAEEVGGWGVPLPVIDPDIVCRSAETMELYGTPFRYGHFLRVKRATRLAQLGLGASAAKLASQVRPLRDWLGRLRPSGTGPDASARARHWFEYTFVTQRGDLRRVTRVSGGDPGYGETSKMVSEAALSLLRPRTELPERAGVLTPVQAFQDELLGRLQAAGIRFEEVPDPS